MAKTKNIWKLSDKEQAGTPTLPALIRTGFNSVGTSALDPINVVEDYKWTKSPISSRDGTPNIQLTELKIVVNSNVSNIANSGFAAVESGDNKLVRAATIGFGAGLGGKYFGAVGAVGGALAGTTTPLITNATIYKLINENLNDDNEFFTQKNVKKTLEPYSFLYLTKKTGFKYILPYFDNSYFDNSVSFGGDDSTLLKGVEDITSNITSGLAGLTNLMQPGTYIERSQQFAMQDKGRVINIKFPLLNTGLESDIQDNWDLLFGLIYQNRPGRLTRSIIDLPVLYDILIPGVVYMPYAYISSLSIKFLGSRRIMNINNPTGGQLTTIIPDAYEVNISIQGLNDETRNFLHASLTGGITNRVTTSINIPPFIVDGEPGYLGRSSNDNTTGFKGVFFKNPYGGGGLDPLSLFNSSKPIIPTVNRGVDPLGLLNPRG